MSRLAGAALYAALTLCSQAFGLQIQETFTSRANFNGGTAVWNQELGRIHPSMFVINFNGSSPTHPVDVGNGSDGPFEPATYANFGTVSAFGAGVKVVVNTTVRPLLQVTRFDLALNDVLEGVGTNPLVIYSLGNVDIRGDIWCHGDDGTDSVAGVGGAGGAGRCGGTDGGNGGNAGAAGQNGGDVTAAVTGGRGGDFQVASFVGGGGGGSWSATGPTDGVNDSVAGGRAGLFSVDPEFLNLEGGAGGGGGSGSAVTGGGGGGGGGGLVVIHAVGDLNLGDAGMGYGFILANGGNGGDADLGAADAGPGGGGGGGGVQIYVGGTLNLHNNSGSGGSQANAGLGGANAGGGNGGDGGLGRSWLTATGFGGGGVYFPPEEAPITPGDVNFETTQQYVESRSFDLLNASGTLDSAALAPASAEYFIELAGSNDDFASDNTGWTTDLSSVQNKRYIKFRILITNTDPFSPSMVDTATLVYTWGTRDGFEFKAGSCGRIEGASPPGGNWLLWLLPLLTYLVLKFKTDRRIRRE